MLIASRRTILIGLLSDRISLRGPFIICGSSVGLIGCTILYSQKAPGPSYFGTCLLAIGIYPTIPVNISWAMGNAGGEVKKGTSDTSKFTDLDVLTLACRGCCRYDCRRSQPWGHLRIIRVLAVFVASAALAMTNDIDDRHDPAAFLCRPWYHDGVARIVVSINIMELRVNTFDRNA